MTVTKHLLPGLALTLLLAAGVAKAVPHPQPGQANPIDFTSVARGLDECLIGTGLTAKDANAAPFSHGHNRTAK